MNFSTIFGVLFALGVFLAALLTTTKNISVFFDPHAALVVIGGTMAASLICFPAKTLFNLIKIFFRRVLGYHVPSYQIVISEAVNLAKGYRQDDDYLKNNAGQIKNFFLKEAMELITQGGLSAHDIDLILSKRAEVMYRRYEKQSSIFKTIGKFPPAFGLLGTTLGMIALMQNLGGEDSMKGMGPAMAIALVATLYGIAFANLVFIPIGENLHKLNEEENLMREIVLDAVQLIRKKEHPLTVEEHLMSYLLPAERTSVRKVA